MYPSPPKVRLSAPKADGRRPNQQGALSRPRRDISRRDGLGESGGPRCLSTRTDRSRAMHILDELACPATDGASNDNVNSTQQTVRTLPYPRARPTFVLDSCVFHPYLTRHALCAPPQNARTPTRGARHGATISWRSTRILSFLTSDRCLGLRQRRRSVGFDSPWGRPSGTSSTTSSRRSEVRITPQTMPALPSRPPVSTY